ncbi:MAG: molybdopterin-dependent oxidoreductase [Methylomonas sp.]|nr:molybdopterin-dependent oxidoreductase [Methylomonas sp.]PPD22130.1 MAG: nitrate reductase [Methylomonas sp.]PPD25539.1 MAG: nitrate reductase [Methylomonas sp.]PPD36331.1 MAG: nitrate reductase [Methylomonas sp.]PPD40980.1 MAG: nitrate reductase [Methylomonas sp.]
MKTIKTTCPYCGVGCGIAARVDAASRQVTVQGDQNHPANFGRLCSKGLALAETLALDTRLLRPQIGDRVVNWGAALDHVADGFRRIIAEHGPDAVALYASGQLLTEDYYVANKLMKGFIGSANIDTNSRLCMSSSVAGHKRAFGADTVPGCYEDLELTDMIVLIGSNAAWCHPVSFQRIRAAKKLRPDMKIVVIDPRRTSSCDIADLHLPLAPGSDVLLFNGLLRDLQQRQRLDAEYIQHHTNGFASAMAEADSATPERVAEGCGLPLADVTTFYRWFGEHNKVMSLYSQGVNQSTSGTDKVNSIINCHLATGRIGKPGRGPFSLTGQPNAMGGREVGGLAHQLAAHMDFTNPNDVERVARFWGSERIARQPGYPAVALFDAIHQGKVKAVWIMGTNPVVSLPDADKVRQALARCELVVVSDCVARTDTSAWAHVLLPAAGWGEKDGTVTNSERRISRQRALLPFAGDAKPDWWIISQVAHRLGYGAAFDYQTPADIFREHAALSGFENDAEHGVRDFDISGLANLDDVAYAELQPVQWPVNPAFPEGRARLFDDGRFFTASGRAQFVAATPKPPAHPVDADYPLVLNTGRVRDQWHTMTRTAIAAKLNQHRPEVYVDVHPVDAERHRLSDGGLARLDSMRGHLLARVRVTDDQAPGSVFVPMHWTAQFASQGRVGVLIGDSVDPISKQPESKHTPVKIAAFDTAWQGFVMARQPFDVEGIDYWNRIHGDEYQHYELAATQALGDVSHWLRSRLPMQVHDEWLACFDAGSGAYRAAQIVDDRLEAVVMMACSGTLPDRQWLASLFAKHALDATDRLGLLSACPVNGQATDGATVCACFGIGERTICRAIDDHDLKTTQDVGQCLKAGTGCGSCVPEISKLLALASA